MNRPFGKDMWKLYEALHKLPKEEALMILRLFIEGKLDKEAAIRWANK